MNSFLIISKNPQKQQAFIEKFCKDHAISKFDTAYISDEDLQTGKQGSIGIEAVRKMQERLFLKPFQGQEKVLIIENAHNLTREAQNAMLKILEEPPAHTYIMLFASRDDAILPTIYSRCQIIILEKEQEDISEENMQKADKDINILLHGTVGEKLALAESIAKEKESLENWFEKVSIVTRSHMLSQEMIGEVKYLTLLEALQEAYKVIFTTNVSARTTLEHYFLTVTN